MPATLALIEADLDSPAALGNMLGAAVPGSWPPGEYDRDAMEFFRARLANDPDAAGWYGWYALYREDDRPVVIGMVGYLGPPDGRETVEVGYSIVPEYRGQSFASEVVGALANLAWTLPGIARIIAHAEADNEVSIHVLERCGFARAGQAGEHGTIEFELLRPKEAN